MQFEVRLAQPKTTPGTVRSRRETWHTVGQNNAALALEHFVSQSLLWAARYRL